MTTEEVRIGKPDRKRFRLADAFRVENVWFSHEQHGVSLKVQSLCEASVFIPTSGTGSSINLATCASVALYAFTPFYGLKSRLHFMDYIDLQSSCGCSALICAASIF